MISKSYHFSSVSPLPLFDTENSFLDRPHSSLLVLFSLIFCQSLYSFPFSSEHTFLNLKRQEMTNNRVRAKIERVGKEGTEEELGIREGENMS